MGAIDVYRSICGRELYFCSPSRRALTELVETLEDRFEFSEIIEFTGLDGDLQYRVSAWPLEH